MQHMGDYGSSYYNYNPPPAPAPPPPQNPNPNLNDLLSQSPYASAPPFSSYSSSSISPPYPIPPPTSSSSTSSSPYSQFPHNPELNPNPNPNPNPNFPPSASVPAPAPPFSFSVPSDPPPSTYPHLQTQPQPQPQPKPQTQTQPQPTSVPYYPYDQPTPNYPTNPNPNPNPIPNSYSYSSSYAYEPPYDPTPKFDRSGSGYLDDSSARYGYARDPPPDFYEQRRYDRSGSRGDALDDGVYAYDGGSVEPYGARGIGGFKKSSSSSSPGLSEFDDYGRPLNLGKDRQAAPAKIVRAVPKAETNSDVRSGVQKFRVRILAEGGGQSTMDVLCQIGLDGIRMLDPNTSRTLRIYPLDTVTRWEVNDPSIYTFWAKSSVDIDPRRIRLQSNSYTTNTILDTVAAATVQLKEMGGNRIRAPADLNKLSEQPAERKKGFADWMNLIKPGNEEKDHWVPDEAVTKCTSCGTDFGAFVRKHHCRNCGDIFCDKCTQGRTALTADENAPVVRVCDRCLAEVSFRLSNAKEAASKSAALQSHEDLARKLQEELERNRKGSSGSKSSDVSGRRMKEVACPTCTVHLQVQVPVSGSETIECGVCQHPFLVSAH